MLKRVYCVRRLPSRSEDEDRFVDCANSAILFSTEYTIF